MKLRYVTHPAFGTLLLIPALGCGDKQVSVDQALKTEELTLSVQAEGGTGIDRCANNAGTGPL